MKNRRNKTMDIGIILRGEATLEDMVELNKLGYEFVIEDGKVSKVIY